MLRPISALIIASLAIPAISMAQESGSRRTKRTTRTTTTAAPASNPASPGAMAEPVTTTDETTTVTPSSDGQVTTGKIEQSSQSRGLGGFFLEPYVSVGQDSSSIKGISGLDTEGSTQKLTGGARLGIHVGEVVFGGLDGRYSRANFDNTFYGDVSGNMVNVGPMLGLQFPVLGLRAWGSYILLGTYDPGRGDQNLDVAFSDPRGYRLGAGYRFTSVSLNVEYENISWRDSDVESAGVNGLPVQDIDLDNEGFNVSLSFPIEL